MFYDIFTELCKENNVTPAKVGRELGIKRSTMSMWKTNGVTPNMDTLTKLSLYFKVTIDYLIGLTTHRLGVATLGEDGIEGALKREAEQDARAKKVHEDAQAIIEAYKEIKQGQDELSEAIGKMNDKQREEVLRYAQYLLDKDTQDNEE